MSDESLPEIKRLHAEGLSARQIAISLNMETKQVSRIMLVNRLRQGNKASNDLSPTEVDSIKSMASQGRTPTEIADELRISANTARRYLDALGVEYTTNRVRNRIKKQRLGEQIKELSSQGVSHREIRLKLGMSETAYNAYRQELGLGRGRVIALDHAEVRALSKQGMSEAEIADHLGVTRRRVHASLLSGAPSEDDGPQHGIVGGIMMQQGCECELCSKARAILNQEARAKNDLTRETATNRLKEWTGAELEVIVRTDLSAKQKAEILKRTLFAVNAAVHRSKYDPAWIEGFGIKFEEKKRYRATPRDIDLMLDRSLTAGQVAARLGCSENTVRAYRSGKIKSAR